MTFKGKFTIEEQLVEVYLPTIYSFLCGTAWDKPEPSPNPIDFMFMFQSGLGGKKPEVGPPTTWGNLSSY